MNYYKTRILREEPQPPEGWGLATIMHSDTHFGCQSCGKRIGWREQYLYSFQPNGTPCLHNTEECTKELRRTEGTQRYIDSGEYEGEYDNKETT